MSALTDDISTSISLYKVSALTALFIQYLMVKLYSIEYKIDIINAKTYNIINN